ncbi:MAG: glycosyltransferase [Alphaproteobacteria bacterium]|nr:glycosyltransferase [Alphaproteobacteria bacterium]
MGTVLVALASASLLAWVYLFFFRHWFWRAAERLPAAPPSRPERAWPHVAVVVPARDEAATIAATLEALLAQDYPGPFTVTLVDDGSRDGTGAIAARIAAAPASAGRLRIVAGTPLPEGWSGKLWAVENGIRAVRAGEVPPPEFVFLTDADTVHGPATLRRLVGHAETQGRDMVSLMVRLACATSWEKRLTPAFVYFFQMLYPFGAVNDDRRAMAGAAGACILVRRSALERAGGIAAIRGALIDDCALAAAVKRTGGRLWLGLADDNLSLRRYPALAEFWDMVARTAYTQLRYSPLRLAGTILGLSLVFLAPPVLTLLALATADWPAVVPSGAAWALMTGSFAPILRYYRLSAVRAVALPAIATLYLGMTFDSARRHWRGRGGLWKGRTYAVPPSAHHG